MTPALLLVALAASSTADLQQVLEQMRMDQEVPGVSAVVTLRGEVLFAGASGQADIESGKPMTADTVLYAGSLSKILTSIVTLQLIDEGKLYLHDLVPGIGSESPGGRDLIRIEDLLRHTSGLNREGDFGYWFNANFPDESELAQYLATTDLLSAPGAEYRYSNIGFAALGPVIARASGQSYAETLRTSLFKPLGMESSGAPGPAPGVASGYTPIGRIIPNEERPFAGVGREVGNRYIREYHDAKAMTPAFGAYATARDLSRLARLILGYGPEGILSDAARAKMVTSPTSGRGLGLGVGRFDGRPVARHGGWFAAHRSHLLLDLEAEIGVVVLTNSDSASPDEIAGALLKVAYEHEVAHQPATE